MRFLQRLARKENLLARIICLLMACGLWVYVMTDQNPIIERNIEVRLQQRNLPQNMMVFNAPDKILVKVRGSRAKLSSDNLSAEINASINLKNITEGQQSLPITVTYSGGEIVSITPKEVSVYVDTVSEKKVPVTTRIVGAVNGDMTIGNSIITPAEVTLRGATHRIDKVNRVVAPIDISNHTGSFQTENELIRRKIGIVWQQNCLDDILTVEENLLCRGSLYEKDARKNRASLDRVTQLLKLDDVLKRRYGKLSGGQKRRCEIAAALMHTPEILFLDEPTTGLDPATRKSVWETVGKLRSDYGMTVFLTTHYMEEAAQANHIVLLDSGKVVASGTPFELKERFAHDSLKIQPKDTAQIQAELDKLGFEHIEREGIVIVPLKATVDALPILEKLGEKINGFEVVQGTMDDVFLNACGKALND